MVTHSRAGWDIVRRVPLPSPPNAEHVVAMPALRNRRWTADDVRALPDTPGVRYQVVDGELLVSPGPIWRHQLIVAELWRRLDDHGRSAGVGRALIGPGEFEFDPFTLVQPDVFVVAVDGGRVPLEQREDTRVLLVVEVLSPSTARHDRVKKRPRYQRAGVESWIVDIDARLVERWAPAADRPEVLLDAVTWAPESGPGLMIGLADLFASALGENASDADQLAP